MRRSDIGVLALQGDFEAHRKALGRCGVEAREVRLPGELEELRGLILPGGESTTLLRLVREYGFDEAIPRFLARDGALYGTCAGAILVAREVLSPSQWSLGLIDIAVERNGYGRQVDSFETELTDLVPELLAGTAADQPPTPLPAVFIRAPRIRRVAPGVAVLASRDGEPVLVRDRRILLSTFHPELTQDCRVHGYFLNAVAGAPVPSPAAIVP